MASAEGKDRVGRLELLLTGLSEDTSFLAPELMQYSYEDFKRYGEALPQLKAYDQLAQDFFARKEHGW